MIEIFSLAVPIPKVLSRGCMSECIPNWTLIVAQFRKHWQCVIFILDSELQSELKSQRLSMQSQSPWIFKMNDNYLVTLSRNSVSFLCLCMFWNICSTRKKKISSRSIDLEIINTSLLIRFLQQLFLSTSSLDPCPHKIPRMYIITKIIVIFYIWGSATLAAPPRSLPNKT